MQTPYYLLFIATFIPALAGAQDPGGTPGATGTVTGTYRGNTISYTTVRAKDGWVWLKQNLGSTQVASSATDAASYGDLFQWGRWDDGHQTRSPENIMDGMPTPNNPAGLNLSGNNPFYKGGGITWYNDGTVHDSWNASTPSAATATNGCDPCRQIFGAGWQLPSLADWHVALAAEGVNNVATGFASNLKLTAAGGRNELLGTLSDPGIASIYWSSTPEAGSAPQAMYINLGTGNLSDYNYRGIGMSLRCLKKSLPTSIKENKTGSSIRLYPNPATDYLTVSHEEDIAGELQVTNILGCVVVSEKLTGSKQPLVLALSNLADGTYFLQWNHNGQRLMKQFVIQR